MGMVASRGF